MISVTKYKNRPAILVKGNNLSATFLPLDGAKLASLKTNLGKELLATRSDENYKVLTYNGSYVNSECSGFDDMFPTVDPHEELGLPTYPDHGETCRLEYEYEIFSDTVKFKATSKIFPITYEKSVVVINGDIKIYYKITNYGVAPFKYLWAGHVMLQGESGIQLLTPYKADAKTQTMFITKGLTLNDLPKTTLLNYEKEKGPAYKFYYLDKIEKGYFALKYPSGNTLTFNYDENKLPYLGVWLNNGEFQNLYTVTPEPCTAPFDSPLRAEKAGVVSYINGGDAFEFDITVNYKEI